MAKKLKPNELEKKIHEEFKTQKPKHPGGRPSIYTPELAARICKLVATHPYGLRKLCKMHDWLPNQDTINEWRFDYPEFSGQYTQAKIQQAELLAEDCTDIADNDEHDTMLNKDGYETFNSEYVARSRLRIDTRKWLASKLVPRIYGDKKELEEEKEKNEELRQQVAELRAKLDAQNARDY